MSCELHGVAFTTRMYSSVVLVVIVALLGLRNAATLGRAGDDEFILESNVMLVRLF